MRKEFYGDKECKKVEHIAMYQNHFFVFEKTGCRLRWVERCLATNDWTLKKEKEDGRDLSSLALISKLFEHKGEVRCFEDRIQGSKINGDIVQCYIRREEMKPVKPFTVSRTKTTEIWGADIETYVNDDGVHIAYCFCAKRLSDGLEIASYHEKGKKACVLRGLFDMVEATKKSGRGAGKMKVYFHNLGFDAVFLYKHLSVISRQISKSRKTVLQIDARFGKKQIEFQDSSCILTMPLSKFRSELGLDIGKHDNFNHNVSRLPFIEQDSHPTVKGSLKTHVVDYCMDDVRVLVSGIQKFDIALKENLGISFFKKITMPGIAYDYANKEKCFEGCYELSGVLKAYLQQQVVGGKVMIALNDEGKEQPAIHKEKKVRYLDMTSLYPTAMIKIPGIPLGEPKKVPIKSGERFYVRDNMFSEYDYFFVTLKVLNRGRKNFRFPCGTYCEDNKRVWTNNLNKRVIHIDKITYDMYVKYGLLEKFEFIEGVYYDEGFNTNICEVIQKLFDMRLDEKKRGNNILQLLYKLIMNSIYGKSIQKFNDKEERWTKVYCKCETKIDNCPKCLEVLEKCLRYVGNKANMNSRLTYYGFNSFVKTTYDKTIDETFNLSIFGIMVLSMSKSIMMDITSKIDPYIIYGDTDSIMVVDDGYQKLCKINQDKIDNGKLPLFGKLLGQMHGDFDGPNPDASSDLVILVQRKVYLALVEGFLHVRIKGLPLKAVEQYMKEKEPELTHIKRMILFFKYIMNHKACLNTVLKDGFKAQVNKTGNWQDVEEMFKEIGNDICKKEGCDCWNDIKNSLM